MSILTDIITLGGSYRAQKKAAKEQKIANQAAQAQQDLQFQRQKQQALARGRAERAAMANAAVARGQGTEGTGVQGQLASAQSSLFGEINAASQMMGLENIAFERRQRAANYMGKAQMWDAAGQMINKIESSIFQASGGA